MAINQRRDHERKHVRVKQIPFLLLLWRVHVSVLLHNTGRRCEDGIISTPRAVLTAFVARGFAHSLDRLHEWTSTCGRSFICQAGCMSARVPLRAQPESVPGRCKLLTSAHYRPLTPPHQAVKSSASSPALNYCLLLFAVLLQQKWSFENLMYRKN